MALALLASSVHANFHLFKIQQIYSNADGTVQFVVLKSFVDAENRGEGHYIKGIDPDGITAHVPVPERSSRRGHWRQERT